MSEWLSYQAHDDSNGQAVFVDFDAELDDRELQSKFPESVILTVGGFETDADGLPTSAAEDQLYELEQRIEAILDDKNGKLAVCVATAGKYAFVTYFAQTPLSSLLQTPVSLPLTSESQSKRDPEWEAYKTWALEGDDLEEERDRAQLDQLEEYGVDLTEETEITFDFEFAKADDALAADLALASAGFAATGLMGNDLDSFEAEPVVHVAVRAVPTIEAIADAR